MTKLLIAGGPMLAGKTTWLLKHAQTLSPESYTVFKPNIDTRYAQDACVTHDGFRMPAENLLTENPVFPELPSGVTTVFIDELNFFQEKTLWPHIQQKLQQGRNVIAAGLLYDFQKQPFGATLPLSQKADVFTQLYAKCDGCHGKANQSYRKIMSQEKVVLGAAESYGACCETCWTHLNSSSGK